MFHDDTIVSHSDSKYRKYYERMFVFFYTTILVSIGISISIYGTATDGSSEKMMAAKIYYIFIYQSSVVIVVALWIYLFIQRNKTHEALIKGGNESFQFLLSKRGEKVNMYLRFGLALFGICSLAYISIATYIRTRTKSSTESFIIHGFSQALFITMQTLFILFYHRLVTLTHKNIMKFTLLHLTIANILMWANASIGKVSSEFESAPTCNQKQYHNVCLICLYLLPTVSEYAVIATAVIYEVYLRIGKSSLIELEQHETKKSTIVHSSKTLPGILVGALLVFGCIFSSISSVVLHLKKIGDEWIYHFHSSQMIILNIMGIVFLVITFRKIRTMKFSVSLKTSSLDKNILFVSYILLINFSLIVSIICGKFLGFEIKSHFEENLKLRLVSAMFEIVQASLQTHLIIECFQRCSYDNKQKELKPGRYCFAILLAINFGLWFLWTLQIKSADIIYHKDKHGYTFITMNGASSLLLFFLQTTLPMGMLYRYHSSACLSDIYTKIYQTESERFVEHLRSGKLQNENGILSNDLKYKPLSKKKSNRVEFTNKCFESENNSVNCAELPYKKRSYSVGILPYSVLKSVNQKMIRRATLKNMQEAQYKFDSEKISHQMLHRKMSPEAALPKGMRNEKDTPEKMFPNVNRMFQECLFSMKLDDSDNDSAYSI